VGLLKRRKPDAPVAHPGVGAVVDIRDAAPRSRVRVRGQVTRMRARPTSGLPALAVSITDATGTVTAVWTGRRSIGGITLGRSVVIEGVAVQHGAALEFTNPAYTLLPR
jgi:RecG-like helicase